MHANKLLTSLVPSIILRFVFLWRPKGQCLCREPPFVFDPCFSVEPMDLQARILKRFRTDLALRWSSYVPPELLTIIVEYAIEYAHYWSSQSMPMDVGPRIIDNFVMNEDMHRWYRVTSQRIIGEGPSRWRIKSNFHGSKQGWLAFGVTGASSFMALPDLQEEDHWKEASTNQDFLIRTSVAPRWKTEGRPMLQLTDGKIIILPHTPSSTTETTAFVEFDLSTRTLAVDQLIDERRWIHVRLTVPTEIGCCRPCIVLSGSVCAAILPWTEDDFFEKY